MTTEEIKAIIAKYELFRSGDKLGTYKKIDRAEFVREVGGNKADIMDYMVAQEKAELEAKLHADVQYTLNTTEAYGIYNGISEFAISDLIKAIAAEVGVDAMDYGYSNDRIAQKLSKDPAIIEAAHQSYVPYPVQDGWTEEAKRIRRELIVEGCAPGCGMVPNALLRERLRVILTGVYNEVTLPRLERAAAKEKEREEIMSRVARVDTTEEQVEDEGGKTVQYTHRVLMPSGKTYEFTDRNVFDFGRVVSYNGMMLAKEGDTLCWERFVSGEGWVVADVVSDPESDEAYLAYRAASMFGHAGHGIRM